MPVPRLVLVRSRLLSASAVALGVACSLPAGAQAAAAAARCTPPGHQRSAQAVVRADRADGSSEVTEYLAGGEYRVTRCGRGGKVQISQTVSPIPDPDGGFTLVPTETEAPGVTVAALYGDPSEPTWAAAFREHRARDPRRDVPPTAAARQIAPAPTPAAPADPMPPSPHPLPDDPPVPAPRGPRNVRRRGRLGRRLHQCPVHALDRRLHLAHVRLPRQPQPLQLQRHLGRLDRRRSHELGHDVQQLRPQRHHEPHVEPPRLDKRDDSLLSRRPVDHRSRRPVRRRLRGRARLHVAVHQRRECLDRDRPALLRRRLVLERRRGGRL